MASPIGSTRNVKIFVLYLLENINYPLDFITINDIVMQTDYVMYLDFAEGFGEMLDGGLIESVEVNGETLYVVTEKGKCVARELNGDILSTILDQSLARALRYLDFKKRGITPKCEIKAVDGGKYEISCSFTENGKMIFFQSLTVDTLDRAQRMKNNFYERPEAIYRGVLALMAGNVNYLFD
ncbi:MAG: DUF4364 family protein [Clostridia bacterium]|nr:DUF4364 family protein [Clostridia bacterium]